MSSLYRFVSALSESGDTPFDICSLEIRENNPSTTVRQHCNCGSKSVPPPKKSTESPTVHAECFSVGVRHGPVTARGTFHEPLATLKIKRSVEWVSSSQRPPNTYNTILGTNINLLAFEVKAKTTIRFTSKEEEYCEGRTYYDVILELTTRMERHLWRLASAWK